MPCAKFSGARIQIARTRHLLVNETNTNQLRGNFEMTKFFSIAAAFALFAPIATAVLMQASQIVA